MRILKSYLFIFLVFITNSVLSQVHRQEVSNYIKTINDIKVGADKTEEYLPLVKGKKVGIVANQSSMINSKHLVDSLLSLGVSVKKVFSPEHGFRGLVDAGKKVDNVKDEKTGLPIVSLYGKNKKPSAESLKDVDIIIFDIQDVGVRFYTYLSTLHYVMEACAESNKKLIVLDRPNPNGYYIDGPVLEDEFKSFLGFHPVPLVYGMTIGEYAQMINGEGWLKNEVKCDLTVITLQGYSHFDWYQLPIKPSPNLPNMASVYLYPSLGLFEGTIISVGRGTDKPFQIIGHPSFKDSIHPSKNGVFSFTPQEMTGATNPKFKGEVCYGYDLSGFGLTFIKSYKRIYLYWLMEAYKNAPDKNTFFDKNFNYHAGNSTLQKQIKDGVSEEEIRSSWAEDIKKFKEIRKKYLLYYDFQ